MAAAPDTIPTAVAVTRRSVGRGTQITTFSGTSPGDVFAAAERQWHAADPWLRGMFPALSGEVGGVFEASVTVYSAE